MRASGGKDEEGNKVLQQQWANENTPTATWYIGVNW